MAELKKDGIRAVMSERVERETLKSTAQRSTDNPTQLENKLEPCPWCPFPTQMYFAIREVGWQGDRETDRRKVVVCSQCGAQGPVFGVMSFNDETTAAQYWNSRAPVVAPQEDAGISWTALLSVLERLRSKNRNPDNVWYHGWNAAIQCLINDINARSSSPYSPVPPEQKRHEFLQFPLGRFRNPKDDIGKCWHVVNMLYCGLPADAEIHQPAATPAPVEQERRKCTRQPWSCRYPDARQCAHDTMLGAECPKVCACACHGERPRKVFDAGFAATETSDSFYCENCEKTFTDSPHATDDGYWLCDPCWETLKEEVNHRPRESAEEGATHVSITVLKRISAQFQAYWDRHPEEKERAAAHPVTEVEEYVNEIINTARWSNTVPAAGGEGRLPVDYRQPHEFVSIGNGVDECECGLVKDADLHITAAIVGEEKND